VTDTGQWRLRAILIWMALGLAVSAPLVAAMLSPLLAWREPIYIVSGFAGVVGLALMLFQPLLAGGYLPGLPAMRGRRVHRWIGAALVACVVGHVAGLWITTPPDVIDALLLVSPTPFSIWGVIAMSAVFATAALALLRRRWRVPPRLWRRAHTALAAIIVVGTILHALLIQGTMETVTKALLCLFVLVATAKVMLDLRVWTRSARSDASSG